MSDPWSRSAPHAVARPLDPPSVPEHPLVQRLGGVLRRVAFHVMHPELREPCVESRPAAAVRLYYEASDGWRAPLTYVAPAPGGAGEPVVLAHALGVGAEAFRYGASDTLAAALSRAGFAVYLLAHRGDRAASAPRQGLGFDFDDILERDVPAALARVREHAAFPRVHWVGHGLGGQLGLAWAGRTGSDELATVAALCAPAGFTRRPPRSEARRVAHAAAFLPSHWQLPSRALAWAATPWVADDHDVVGHVVPGSTDGPRLRGVLSHAVEDLPVGLLAQVGRWMRSGTWSDRTGMLDYAESLAGAACPLFVVSAGDDDLCDPADAELALARWGDADRRALALPEGWGHLDPVLARDATDQVHAPLVAWLVERRRRSWDRLGSHRRPPGLADL